MPWSPQLPLQWPEQPFARQCRLLVCPGLPKKSFENRFPPQTSLSAIAFVLPQSLWFQGVTCCPHNPNSRCKRWLVAKCWKKKIKTENQ